MRVGVVLLVGLWFAVVCITCGNVVCVWCFVFVVICFAGLIVCVWLVGLGGLWFFVGVLWLIVLFIIN